MAKKDLGWIKVHRSICDNFIWKKNDPFDKRSALIDLFMMANHEDGEFAINSTDVIKIRRGQFFTSIENLAKRWHWSEGKVRRFLSLLVSANMIYKSGGQYGTLVTIVNYGKYQ